MVEVLVRGSNIAVDRDLDSVTRRKLGRMDRLASDIRRIEVQFSEVRNPRVADREQCEIIVHLTRNFVKAHASAGDARCALDRAVAKAEHQLSRVHSKRVARHKPKVVAQTVAVDYLV